jgi:LacI family transcriptional regulator
MSHMAKARPTMLDVARAAGVSLKTVSRVVNNEAYVNESTRLRVNRAIDALGFRRNDLAHSLRRSQISSTIGLVIEDIANPFYSMIARGVEEVAQQRHHMVIVSSNEKSAARERELVSALLRRRVAGLLIVPAGSDHSYLVSELHLGTPTVFLDRPPQAIDTDMILLDNRGGARKGVEHLLTQGHRRIGFVGGDPLVYTGAERLLGYKEALAAWHIPFDEVLLRMGRHDVIQAEAATMELLSLPDPPTAIFADNNRMSVGVLRAVHRGNVSLSLVGFDDIELADLLSIPITVVAHEAIEMGRQAAHLLFSRLEDTQRPPQRLVMPTHLIVRGSGVMPPVM